MNTVLLLMSDDWPILFEGVCLPKPVGCGEPVTGFRDRLSLDEFLVSKLCQKCQDDIFEAELED